MTKETMDELETILREEREAEGIYPEDDTDVEGEKLPADID